MLKCPQERPPTARAGGPAGKTCEHDGTASTVQGTACSGTATKTEGTVCPPVGATAATGKTVHEAATQGRGADERSQRRPPADKGCHDGWFKATEASLEGTH